MKYLQKLKQRIYSLENKTFCFLGRIIPENRIRRFILNSLGSLETEERMHGRAKKHCERRTI